MNVRALLSQAPNKCAKWRWFACSALPAQLPSFVFFVLSCPSRRSSHGTRSTFASSTTRPFPM